MTAFGAPTGRPFVSRTIADCMVFENRVYKEWLVRDNMAVLKQLGVEPHGFAEKLARDQFNRGMLQFEIGDNRRMLGQYPPAETPDLSIAHSDSERACLAWLHAVYNRRMFGLIRDHYAPQVQWHGPGTRELYGVAAVLQATMKLIAMLPDAHFVPQHVCSVPNSTEGGEKIAVRWVIDGHHLGHGSLGAPTGHRVFVMGMTHFHIVDGKVVEEWTIYDELAMLAQVKLATMGASA